ncbi:MAG: hypothetical protein Q4F12_01390 [Erysipelotrichaceae bacterium]|nr:hypothetical protein [Erysipelotrichaceae bacterium]
MIEAENGVYDYPINVLNDSQKIVYHVDSIISSMDDKAKFILENEVKLRKTGEWYRDYCSSTTYYRIREDIYNEFIKELDK